MMSPPATPLTAPGTVPPGCIITRWQAALDHLPLVAILRGLTPDEAVPIGQALAAAGFRLIEVPLNSPQPFVSIARLRQALPSEVLVGAGTVRRADELQVLASTGAELAVSPHADLTLVRMACALGLVSVPGVLTPTEALAALDAGAHALKLFPAELMPPVGVQALRAVLPPTTPLLPVGSVTPERMAVYRQVGAAGFGLGSALYAPGRSVAEVTERAAAFVAAWRKPPA